MDVDPREPGGEHPSPAEMPEEESGHGPIENPDELVIYDQQDSPPPSSDIELSEVRIRQIAALRKAAYRSRSHAIIGFGICVVMFAQLCLVTSQHWRDGERLYPSLTTFAALVLAFGVIWCAKLVLRLHQQTKPPPPVPSAAPGDLSALSDGSQRWKNLENVEE